MFKEILLATTALLAVPSIALTEASSGDSAGADRVAARHLSVADRSQDKNSKFLCAYGGYEVSDTLAYDSGSVYSHWKRIAVPIKGHGKTVDSIVLQDATGFSRDFGIGLYSSSRKRRPGHLMASAVSKATRYCKDKKVSISPTLLEQGKEYWVVESVPAPREGTDEVQWAIDPVAPDDAYSQYHTYSSVSSNITSYTSPWKHIAGRAPFVRVK